MVPSVWGQVCDRLLPHRARPFKLTTSCPRSTSARIPMLLSNRGAAAPSCNALTTGVFRHDLSISTSLSFFFSLLLNSGPIHDHPLGPEQSIAIARADKDVGLKESSAGLARNLPRLRGSSPVVFCRPFRHRSSFSFKLCRQCT